MLTKEEYVKFDWLIESGHDANNELLMGLLKGKGMSEWEILVWVANRLVARGGAGSVCIRDRSFQGIRSQGALIWFYRRLGHLWSFDGLVRPGATEDDLHVAFGSLIALFGWSYREAGARVVHDLLRASGWKCSIFPEMEGDFSFLGRKTTKVDVVYVDAVFSLNCAIFQRRIPEFLFSGLLVNRFLQQHRVLAR